MGPDGGLGLSHFTAYLDSFSGHFSRKSWLFSYNIDLEYWSRDKVQLSNAQKQRPNFILNSSAGIEKV